MADKKVERVLRMREGADVMRCHLVRHFGEYSVGSHSFGMLLLLVELHSKPTKALYKAVIMHDLSERFTGDVPGMVGRIDPDFKQAFKNATELVDEELGYVVELTTKEKQWLQALDKLELWMWCHDQLNMGNDHVSAMVNEMQLWFNENWQDLPGSARRFYKNYEWQRTVEVIE